MLHEPARHQDDAREHRGGQHERHDPHGRLAEQSVDVEEVVPHDRDGHGGRNQQRDREQEGQVGERRRRAEQPLQHPSAEDEEHDRRAREHEPADLLPGPLVAATVAADQRRDRDHQAQADDGHRGRREHASSARGFADDLPSHLHGAPHRHHHRRRRTGRIDGRHAEIARHARQHQRILGLLHADGHREGARHSRRLGTDLDDLALNRHVRKRVEARLHGLDTGDERDQRLRYVDHGFERIDVDDADDLLLGPYLLECFGIDRDDTAGEGRFQDCEVEIDPRPVQRGLHRGDARFRALLLAERIIAARLRIGAALHQRNDPVVLVGLELEIGAGIVEIGRKPRDLGLIGTGIERRDHRAGFDVLADPGRQREDLSGHTEGEHRLPLGLGETLKLALAELLGHADLKRRDEARRRRRFLALVGASGGEQPERERQAKRNGAVANDRTRHRSE